jgi:hypothetical protein
MILIKLKYNNFDHSPSKGSLDLMLPDDENTAPQLNILWGGPIVGSFICM